MTKYIVIILILLLVYTNYNSIYKEYFTTNSTNNIILMGDSILDNSNYVSTNLSVFDFIKKTNKNVYNFAHDGATINDCYNQLDKISTIFNKSSSYIFVSIGGNNILNQRTEIDTSIFKTLFTQYVILIKSIKTKFPNANIYVLNLYYPLNSHYTSYHKTIAMWNKLLIENQLQFGYKIMDTNKLINKPEDLTYDIEPSVIGGTKIANAILQTI